MGEEDIHGIMVTRDDEGAYSCHMCGKTFQLKRAVVAHMKKHSQVRKYSCKLCEMRFKESFTLQQHMRRHTGERPYKCRHTGCEKAFKQKSQLDQHTRLHTGERPHACTYCAKTFVQKNHLDRHERTHTGEKPYPCGMCDLCFADRCSLNKHVKRHGTGPIRRHTGAESGKFDRRRSGRPRKVPPSNTAPKLLPRDGPTFEVVDLVSDEECRSEGVPESLLQTQGQPLEDGYDDWDF